MDDILVDIRFGIEVNTLSKIENYSALKRDNLNTDKLRFEKLIMREEFFIFLHRIKIVSLMLRIFNLWLSNKENYNN